LFYTDDGSPERGINQKDPKWRCATGLLLNDNPQPDHFNNPPFSILYLANILTNGLFISILVSNYQTMKNKALIIVAALLAVIICLVLALMMFYNVPHSYIVTLAFVIGVITGVITTAIIFSLKNIIQNNRIKDAKQF
jgi:protein-S-isoprenylcysteine O-methyltransferase Ste14